MPSIAWKAMELGGRWPVRVSEAVPPDTVVVMASTRRRPGCLPEPEKAANIVLIKIMRKLDPELAAMIESLGPVWKEK